MTPIPPVVPQVASPASPSAQAASAQTPGAQTFDQVLQGALQQVTGAQTKANQLASSFSIGGPVSLDQVMSATAQAELLTQTTAAIVTRALTAYQTLMQTNIG